MSIERRTTRQIAVGNVFIGGGATISIQSMTTTKTHDVAATVAQVRGLSAAGADLVRCTCNTKKAAVALKDIVSEVNVPIIADVHFRSDLAHLALEAGVSCVRLDPGNITDASEIKAIHSHAQSNGTAVRIGVNSGSVDPAVLERHGGPTADALVESALEQIAFAESVGLANLKVSVKASNILRTVTAYRSLSAHTDWPLHIGLTEAGPSPNGLIKSAAALGSLLLDGIGDTLRVSLAEDPVEEVKAAKTLLESLGLRPRTTLDLIACPSCGRAEVDVVRLAREARNALEAEGISLSVAVMGCAVNGPGEASEADLGIAAGRGQGQLFARGRVVGVVKESEMIAALVEEAKRINSDGAKAKASPGNLLRVESASVDAADVALSGVRGRGIEQSLVPAARALIVAEDTGRALLLQYVEPGTGREVWQLPGGKQQEGEAPIDAAIREVYEETGIVLAGHPGIICRYVNRYRWRGHVHNQREEVFAFSVPEEVTVSPAVALEGEELISYEGHRWLSVEDLERVNMEVVPQALAVVLRSFIEQRPIT